MRPLKNLLEKTTSDDLVVLMPQVLAFCEDFLCELCLLCSAGLCGKFVQLLQGDALSCEDGGEEIASASSEQVAMRSWNLVNQVMGTQDPQQA